MKGRIDPLAIGAILLAEPTDEVVADEVMWSSFRAHPLSLT